MSEATLLALSPLDGRYGGQTADLRQYYSEYALIRYRVRVEIEWLVFVLQRLGLTTLGAFAALPAADVVGRFGAEGQEAWWTADGKFHATHAQLRRDSFIGVV